MAKPPAVIYTRLSKKAREDKDACARQEADCRAWAAGEGIPVERVYTDNFSASDDTIVRPDYDAMMSDLESRRIESRHVLAIAVDRMWRQELDKALFLQLMKKKDLTLSLPNQFIYYANPYDEDYDNKRALIDRYALVSEMEAKSMQRRAGNKQINLARAGKAGGGPRAFGYLASERDELGNVVRPHNTELHPQESELLRQAVEKVLAGTGLRAICREWNEAGVTTPSGRPWRTQVLRNILISPRIAGLRQYRPQTHVERAKANDQRRPKAQVLLDNQGNPVKATWAPIVTADEYEQLKHQLRSKPTTTNSNARSYLLSGMLFCSKCGAKMHSHPSERARRYACKKGDGLGCGSRVTTAEATERYIMALALDLYESGAVEQAVREWEQDQANEGGTNNLYAQLAEANQRVTQWTAMASRIEDMDAYVETLNELTAARKDLEARIERAAAQQRHHPVATAADVRRLWRDGDLEYRRNLVRSVFSRIEVDANPVKGSPRFHGSRFRPLPTELGAAAQKIRHGGDHPRVLDPSG